jgi:hypothetical protein
MKKKIVVIGIIISVILIGIVSASLLDFFGKITGSVKVKGPVFCLDGHLGEAYYKLLTNEIPSEEKEINLIDGNRIVFITEPLGVDEFYKAKFDIHIWIKTNNLGNILQSEVIRIDSNDREYNICTLKPIIIGATEEFQHYSTSCIWNGEMQIEPEDRFGLEIHGVSLDSEYWIRPGHRYNSGGNYVYDRIEVNLAE